MSYGVFCMLLESICSDVSCLNNLLYIPPPLGSPLFTSSNRAVILSRRVEGLMEIGP